MGIAHPRLAAVALTETLHPAAPLTVPWTLSCSTDKKRQGVTGSSPLCIAVAQHSPAKAHTVSSVNVARALTCVSLRSYFKPTAAVPVGPSHLSWIVDRGGVGPTSRIRLSPGRTLPTRMDRMDGQTSSPYEAGPSVCTVLCLKAFLCLHGRCLSARTSAGSGSAPLDSLNARATSLRRSATAGAKRSGSDKSRTLQCSRTGQSGRIGWTGGGAGVGWMDGKKGDPTPPLIVDTVITEPVTGPVTPPREPVTAPALLRQQEGLLITQASRAVTHWNPQCTPPGEQVSLPVPGTTDSSPCALADRSRALVVPEQSVALPPSAHRRQLVLACPQLLTCQLLLSESPTRLHPPGSRTP